MYNMIYLCLVITIVEYFVKEILLMCFTQMLTLVLFLSHFDKEEVVLTGSFAFRTRRGTYYNPVLGLNGKNLCL